jgi:hypothetical protein
VRRTCERSLRADGECRTIEQLHALGALDPSAQAVLEKIEARLREAFSQRVWPGVSERACGQLEIMLEKGEDSRAQERSEVVGLVARLCRRSAAVLRR